MKKIDRLITLELLGPWVFGVLMFSLLIGAASYLFEASNFLVEGVGLAIVFKFLILMMPGIVVKTFAMALLLAGLLGFGRLSGDSEVVALRAGGASMMRMMAPVAVLSLTIALIAFAIDETLVPAAAHEGELLLREVAMKTDPTKKHPVSYPIEDKGKVLGMVVGRDFNASLGVLQGATIILYDDQGKDSSYIRANRLAFDPSQFEKGGGWEIDGGADMLAADGRTLVHLDDKAWPPNAPRIHFTPDDIISKSLNNLDALSMSQITHQIETMRADPKHDPGQLANLQYGYWNKIALPLAAVVYGLLGAPLGVRSGRGSAAGGFALAVGIIFAYVTIANLLNVYAKGGVLPAWAASFTPLGIGLVAAVIIMWRRN